MSYQTLLNEEKRLTNLLKNYKCKGEEKQINNILLQVQQLKESAKIKQYKR